MTRQRLPAQNFGSFRRAADGYAVGVSGSLMSQGDDGGFVHCAGCGALAAGPCARCRKPVCGDCCVLTTGGATPWAICHACEKSGGGSLSRGWVVVLGWFVKPMLLLLVVYIVLRWLAD